MNNDNNSKDMKSKMPKDKVSKCKKAKGKISSSKNGHTNHGQERKNAVQAVLHFKHFDRIKERSYIGWLIHPFGPQKVGLTKRQYLEKKRA